MTDTIARAPAGFRVLPHNIEAEQAVLGAIMINNRAFGTVADYLRSEHFYEPVHGRVYAAMAALIEDGRQADHVTLRERFDQDEALRELDGAVYLGSLVRAASSIVEAGEYGRVVHELALKRGLIRIGEEIANKGYDPEVDEAACVQIQAAQDILDRLSLDQPTEAWRTLEQVLDTIASRLSQPAEIYSTGLPTLDTSMCGGIQPGLVYGLEARGKRFKTGTAGSIALSLTRQAVPYLFIALEMGSARILERLVSHETGTNSVAFRKRQDPEDLLSRVHTFRHRYGARRGHFADEPGLRFDRLKQLANAAVTKLGIRVLFVDYWQLITGQGSRQSKADFLTDTAQWLAAWAPRNNCAVVLASQENRQGESFGSDGLAKACDWLAVLNKVDVEDRMVGSFEALWFDVKFNRDGPDGPIGSEQMPAFRIDKLGPVLREYGDWSRP